MLSTNTNLYQSSLAESDRQFLSIRSIVMLFVGILLLTVSSHIEIPLQPVPVTLQTMVVALIGMTYGWRRGLMTIFIYELMGFLHFPVFATGPNVGPTLGYLLGFVPAVVVCGVFAEKGWTRSFLTAGLTALLSFIIIYIFGISFLSYFIGLKWALTLGLYPFILGDILKILFVAGFIPYFWNRFFKL